MLQVGRRIKSSRDVAHVYARLGWPVLRLAGKVPTTTRGCHDATTDHSVIASWPSDANIGIRCDRLLVLDVDPRHGGDEEIATLVNEHGRLGARTVARTGGGGWHALFSLPAGRLRGKVMMPSGVPSRGLDLRRGAGHYIVAPPSTHPDTGEAYRWIRWDPVVRCAPEWLLSLCRQPESEPAPPPAPEVSDGEIARARAWLSRVEPAVSGRNGHSATYRVACRLVSRGLSDDIVFSLMWEWNQHCDPPWSESEIRRKIREARK